MIDYKFTKAPRIMMAVLYDKYQLSPALSEHLPLH
jgi:hypothetical protein